MSPRLLRHKETVDPIADVLRRTKNLAVEVEADVENSVYSRHAEYLREYNSLFVSLSNTAKFDDFYPIAPIPRDAPGSAHDRSLLEKAKLIEILSKVRLLCEAADDGKGNGAVKEPEHETSKTAAPGRAPRTESVPPWFQIAGFVCGGVTLLFLMTLVVLSVLGHPVPDQAKPLVALVFAIGAAMSISFLGGDAAASGKIPLIGKSKPITFSASSGVAVLIILLVLLHYLYVH